MPTAAPLLAIIGAALIVAAAFSCSSFTDEEEPFYDSGSMTEATSPDGDISDAPGSGDSDADAALGRECDEGGVSDAGLYLIGGEAEDGGLVAGIWRAAICKNGDLLDWRSTALGSLDFLVAAPAAGIANGFLTVASGFNASDTMTYRDRAFTASELDGGAVGPFTASALGNMTGARWRAAFATHGAGLFIVGGERLPRDSAATALTRVDAITVDDAGAATSSQLTSVGEDMAGGAAAVLGNRLYAFGGTADGYVYAADIINDGYLGQWSSPNNSVYREYDLGAAVAEGTIYLIGGRNHPNAITRVTLGAGQTVTVQEPLPVLPRPTTRAAVATYGGVLYVVGGEGHEREVYFGRLSPAVSATDFRSGPLLPGARSGTAALAF